MDIAVALDETLKSLFDIGYVMYMPVWNDPLIQHYLNWGYITQFSSTRNL